MDVIKRKERELIGKKKLLSSCNIKISVSRFRKMSFSRFQKMSVERNKKIILGV